MASPGTVVVDWRWMLRGEGVRFGVLLYVEYAARFNGDSRPRASMWVDAGNRGERADIGAADPIAYTASGHLSEAWRARMATALRRREAELRALYRGRDKAVRKEAARV